MTDPGEAWRKPSPESGPGVSLQADEDQRDTADVTDPMPYPMETACCRFHDGGGVQHYC